jgi:hypothetical protein
MKHPEEQIIDYVDGILGPRERAELERHLSVCPDCREELTRQRSLLAVLKAAEPEVPSERMWAAISARLDGGSPAPEPWTARLTRWLAVSPMPRYGALAAACLALALVFALYTPAPKPGAPATASPAATEAAGAPAASKDRSARPVSQKRRSAAETEAVSENRLAPSQAPALAKADALPERSVPPAASSDEAPPPYAAGPARKRDLSTPVLGGRMVSTGAGPAAAMALAPEAPAPAPASLPPAQGARLADGTFDWGPFEASMRGRDHAQAAAELKSGRRSAGGPAERAFAASATLLLTQSGQPLSAMPLDGEPDAWADPDTGLIVLQAADWNMDSAARQALYQGSVMTRLRGLRSEGQVFVIDWARQQGNYGAGTRFTRLAGEDAVRVFDAAGQAMADNQFRAPRGATYDFKQATLLVK